MKRCTRCHIPLPEGWEYEWCKTCLEYDTHKKLGSPICVRYSKADERRMDSWLQKERYGSYSDLIRFAVRKHLDELDKHPEPEESTEEKTEKTEATAKRLAGEILISVGQSIRGSDPYDVLQL